MTNPDTIAQADEPEWMRVRREIGNGYLRSMSTETAHDVDYLIARLRQILDRGIAEYMPDDIERLVAELQPFTRAGDAAFAELRAAHPQLFWGRYGNAIIGIDDDPALVEQCAKELGLISGEPHFDQPTWEGTYADLPLRVIGGK